MPSIAIERVCAMAIVLVLLRLQALIDAEISACIKVTTNTGAIYDMQCSPQGFLLKYRIFALLSAYSLISAYCFSVINTRY